MLGGAPTSILTEPWAVSISVAGMFGFEPREFIGYTDRPNQSSFPADAQL